MSNLNLTIEQGEFISFLGPSGCGKSTLLSLISGLLQPTTGSIINTFSSQAMAFVFQEASLMPWKSVKKNISLPLELLNKNKYEIEFEVNEKLKMFQLEKVQNYLPHQISGGMKMRTSIARAIVSHPKLLLLDEPFSSLDEILREKCADEILNIWNTQQLTSILVTHSISEAVYLSEKIILLSHKPSKVLEIINLKPLLPKIKDTHFRESELFQKTMKKIRLIMENDIHD